MSSTAADAEQALYVVATPIGNLEDMTYRAVRILSEADIILSEDTRSGGMLLKHYGIETRQLAYHAQNEYKNFNAERLFRENKKVALITEAGTPGLMDPGHFIVNYCHEQGIAVIPLPGASALATAYSASGFPSKFYFHGFLPNKKGKRVNQINELLEREKKVIILYESTHRFIHLLDILLESVPEKTMVVAREVTKRFEEIRKKTVKEMRTHYENHSIKGEFVVLIDNTSSKE